MLEAASEGRERDRGSGGRTGSHAAARGVGRREWPTRGVRQGGGKEGDGVQGVA